MPRLLLPQIQTILAAAAETCALSIATGDSAFFNQLEWWLADGVFNHAPHGMFRTDDPYVVGELRDVAEFLSQEPRHRWEGVHTLRDLFSNQVLELLEGWCKDHLSQTLGDSAPGTDEWENVYVHEWEDALFLADLHPRAESSIWNEFLGVPLATVVEKWRHHAEQVADERRLKAARMLSRQDIERSMIARVERALQNHRLDHPSPHDIPLLLSEVSQKLGEWGPLEVALYVHSTLFSQNADRALLQVLYRTHPIPERWLSEQGLNES